MKNFKIILTAFFIGSLFWACATVPEVYHVESVEKQTMHGFYYALPKTVISTHFTIKKTTVSDAPLKEYAKQYFGQENKPSTSFKIVSASVSTKSVVDSTQWYCVDLKKQNMKQVKVALQSEKNGVISAGNVATEDKTVELVVSGVEIISKVASYLLPTPIKGVLPTAKGSALEKEKMEKGRKDTILLLVKKYYELDDAQKLLLQNAGNSEGDEAKLKYVMQELENRKTEILALFIGEKSEKTIEFAIELSDVSNDTLFSFSTQDGVSGVNLPADIPAGFIDNKKTSTQPVTIAFENQSFTTKSGSSTGTPVIKNASFYYRHPAEVKVSLSHNQKLLKIQYELIAQLGVVHALPQKIGGKKSEYSLKYDPATGAIISIDANGEPITVADLEKIKETSDAVYGYIKPDELSELEKQRKILEEQKKIKELEEALKK